MNNSELEDKIDQLVILCDTLSQKHQDLITEKQNWQLECKALKQKNLLAKTKVEAMITRLKALAQD